MNLEKERKEASELSLGSSSDDIIKAVLKEFKKNNFEKKTRIMDIGCGQGSLLRRIKESGYSNLTGCDYTNFTESDGYDFFQHDCNLPFPEHLEKFNVILCSEVIEHIENPWAFIRNIKEKLKPGGVIIMSTPNPESFLSIVTLFFKGYFNAFGPRDYPAHITPVSLYEIKNMLKKVEITNVSEGFVNNGRIPGLSLKWSKVLPFFKGKRFSDNYFITAKS